QAEDPAGCERLGRGQAARAQRLRPYDLAAECRPRLQRQHALDSPLMTWRRINAALTLIWMFVIPLAIITGWIYSVAFVSAISLYANVASHLAAWRADVPNEDD